MPFKDFEIANYPPRHWSLVSYPGDGKSTFAARMRAPLLPVDADQRFGEVAKLAPKVYQLSDAHADNADPDRIRALLNREMPGSIVGTIVIDSLTAIIAPYVTQAQVDYDKALAEYKYRTAQGDKSARKPNLAALFRPKALAMRLLQDSITKWGTDTLWIYHLNDARDGQGEEVTKATVSATEVIRLLRSINVQLKIVRGKQGEHGIEVVWSRRGREGMTLWDEPGNKWKGMPERLEAAMYDGMSEEEMDRKETSAPEVFPSHEVAIDWAMEQGAFEAINHAQNAYKKLLRDAKPKDMRAMTPLWIADVQHRLELKENGEAGDAGSEDEA